MLKHSTSINMPIYGLSIGIFIAGLLWLFNSYTPIANDDTFIYYNYARNMVEGRFFAHDIRNMPTEGFTSILYLLLLTPFKFFNINMMFGSFIINLFALLLTCVVIYRLFRLNDLLPPATALLGTSLVWLLIVMDSSIILSFDFGLETMLGSLISISAITAFTIAYSQPQNHNAVNIFFILLFVSYLVRPESIAFLSSFAIPLLLFKAHHRRQVIRNIVIFGIIFIAYHGIKYLIFGDIFPTSFYRKVSRVGAGPIYVRFWLNDYIEIICLIVGLLITHLIITQRQLIKLSWLWFMVWIVGVSIIFFSNTSPLVGMGHRFFVTAIIIFYILVIALVLTLIKQLPAKIQSYAPLMIGAIGLIVLFLNIGKLDSTQPFFQRINIYQKAEEAVSNFIYLQFGNHLRQSLTDPDDITLVFGDAGALPYALGGTFIDANGLTEPVIARMFSEPESPEKVNAYIEYIMAFNPDIVILAWDRVSDDGVWKTPFNGHSPFLIPYPIEIYHAYHDQSIIYSCSIGTIFHIGLWADSPHYDELNVALSSFCQAHENGYVLENGLTVMSSAGEAVHFERH